MKVFLKIIWVTFLIASASMITMHAQVYVKKDTTITFHVDKLDTVSSNYTWTLLPAIGGFVSSDATSQTVKWSGNTDSLYTLTIFPIGIVGCDGAPESLSVRLYDSILTLPVKVAWSSDPAPLCPVDTGDSVVVSGFINVTGYSGTYTISYRIDNDTTVETVNFDTSTPASISFFNRGWNNLSNSAFVYHYARITRIEAGGVTQLYDNTNGPLLTITIKPVPGIGEIEFLTK
jgi:hypothetical protein